MRIKLKFDIDNGDLFLPFSYYHYLQAILYKSMGDNLSQVWKFDNTFC